MASYDSADKPGEAGHTNIQDTDNGSACAAGAKLLAEAAAATDSRPDADPGTDSGIGDSCDRAQRQAPAHHARVDPMHESSAAQRGQIGLLVADAGYLSETNLTEPGPDRLIGVGTRRDMDRALWTDPADGPPPNGSPIDQMRHRLRIPQEAERYRRRAATVEPVNGHLKDQIGLRRFSRRGLAGAASELCLASAVANLLKLRNRPAATPA